MRVDDPKSINSALKEYQNCLSPDTSKKGWSLAKAYMGVYLHRVVYLLRDVVTLGQLFEQVAWRNDKYIQDQCSVIKIQLVALSKTNIGKVNTTALSTIFKDAQAKVEIEKGPLGIPNLGNSCWLNTISQIIRNNPGYMDWFYSANFIDDSSKKGGIKSCIAQLKKLNSNESTTEEELRSFALYTLQFALTGMENETQSKRLIAWADLIETAVIHAKIGGITHKGVQVDAAEILTEMESAALIWGQGAEPTGLTKCNEVVFSRVDTDEKSLPESLRGLGILPSDSINYFQLKGSESTIHLQAEKLEEGDERVPVQKLVTNKKPSASDLCGQHYVLKLKGTDLIDWYSESEWKCKKKKFQNAPDYKEYDWCLGKRELGEAYYSLEEGSQPEYLSIELKVLQTADEAAKVTVDRVIDLSPKILGGEEAYYELVAFSHRSGSVGGYEQSTAGHFTAYVFRGGGKGNSAWYHMNDAANPRKVSWGGAQKAANLEYSIKRGKIQREFRELKEKDSSESNSIWSWLLGWTGLTELFDTPKENNSLSNTQCDLISHANGAQRLVYKKIDKARYKELKSEESTLQEEKLQKQVAPAAQQAGSYPPLVLSKE